MPEVQNYLSITEQLAYQYIPKIAGALLVFLIGFWLINFFSRLARKAMRKRHIDISLQSFLASLVNIALKVMLIVTVAGMLGIQTTSFVAIIGAAGLAVGLALQGSLANFAGGVLTLIFKPFKVGDRIEAQGQYGVVQEIQIFNTILLTSDNKTVILPNGAVSNNTIINHSRHGNLRLELRVVLDASSDVAKARHIIMDIASHGEVILKDPQPSVNVMKLIDGSPEMVIYVYVLPEKYWSAQFAIYEAIKKRFDEEGIKLADGSKVLVLK